MICHNCQHVTCPECGFQHDECPKCAERKAKNTRFNRGLGYIHAPLQSTIDLGISQDLPVELDNRGFCGEVTDQCATSSCVAHALANAIQIRTAGEKPCILSIYALARIHSGHTLDDDFGSSLPAALAAVEEHGYCPDAVWPWSPASVHDSQPWDVAQADFDRIGLKWDVITDNIRQRIRSAVNAGLPVIIGTLVDQSFQDLTTFDLWPGCSSGGGHAMVIVGYDRDGVIVMNSWGESWGFGGFGRIAWDHIEGGFTHVIAVLV